MYKEIQIIKQENNINYYKEKIKIKKKGIGIPCLIDEPFLPPLYEDIEESDILRTYDVIDTYKYEHDINDNIEMYIPIDDLIAYGYIVGNKHTLWTFGKPYKLIRHKYGDILSIHPYVENKYYTITCDFSNINSKADIIQSIYISLHEYNDIILSSIFTSNISPAWFSLYCVNHYENYRSALYIVRTILEYDFEYINIHKSYTLHLISNGFRKYSNNDMLALLPISLTVANFIKSTGKVKKAMFTSPLLSELKNMSIDLKHPYDIITTIPSEQNEYL